MGRWIAALSLLWLAGCGTFTGTVPTDPSREVLGVGTGQPKSAGPAVNGVSERTLDYKASQICTRGSTQLRQDVEPAEGDRALVDRQLICKPYHFAIFGYDLAGLVPY